MSSKVYLSKCDKYDIETAKQALREIFSNMGGLESLVSPNDKVFLKLNLLMKKKPDEAATTHPCIVEALILMLNEIGCKVTIGDSPGGPYTLPYLKSIYKATGMTEMAERTGCELNYDLSSQKINVNGEVAKTLDIISPVLDFNKVIGIGKLKTHTYMTATMAVKLCFGYIPGLKKADYHLRMPEPHDFANLLVDIYEARRPDFSIIDAVYGMEGDGPSAGTPIKVGCLIAGTDAHSIDVVGAKIMGISPNSIPTIKCAVERKLSTGNINDIEIIGDTIDKYLNQFNYPKRKLDSYLNKFPKILSKLISSRIKPKPVFDTLRCKGCGDCERACPAKTITMTDNKAYVDLTKCIRCYCCHELCPHKSIDIRQSFISKYLSKY